MKDLSEPEPSLLDHQTTGQIKQILEELSNGSMESTYMNRDMNREPESLDELEDLDELEGVRRVLCQTFVTAFEIVGQPEGP